MLRLKQERYLVVSSLLRKNTIASSLPVLNGARILSQRLLSISSQHNAQWTREREKERERYTRARYGWVTGIEARDGATAMGRSLAANSMIKLIRFQLGGPRRGACEARKSADPAARRYFNYAPMRGTNRARDVTEKLRCATIKATAIFQVGTPPLSPPLRLRECWLIQRLSIQSIRHLW